MKRHLILTVMLSVFLAALAATPATAKTLSTVSAAPLPQVQRTAQLPTQYQTTTTRTRTASCPAGTWVIGGGAHISGGQGRVALTILAPTFSRTGSNYFFAAAIRTDPTFTGSWSLQPYAICAALPNPNQIDLIITSSTSSPATASSATFQHAEAVCPAGKRAISAGAQIVPVGAQTGAVALQLVRTSGPRDIGRATAREAGGNTGTWYVQSHVMCGPVGLVGSNEPIGTLGSTADAGVACPAGTRAHGAGGGGSITDSGLTFLDGVIPSSALTYVSISMTTPPAAGMVAQAVCI